MLTVSAPPKGVTACAVCGGLTGGLRNLDNALPIGREALLRLGGKLKDASNDQSSKSDFPEELIAIPVGITPATLKKYTLYEILGFGGELGASADTEVIKKAYHKAVLMYHPDKAQFKTTDGKEDRTVFLRIQEAFNVLCSEPKRRAYDSQLPFDERIPSEEDCTKYLAKGPHKFFKLFDPVFKRNARFAVKKPVPDLGDLDTPLPQVYKFYEYWIKFESWRDFTGIGAEYKPDDASCREEKRYMQKENEKKAKTLKKNEMDRIIRLVMLAEKKDPRIAREKELKKQSKDADKNAKEAAAKRQGDEEQAAREWSEALETEIRERKGTTKEDREKLKKAQSKARNTFRKLLRASAALGFGPDAEYGFLSADNVELLCTNADMEDVNEMNTAMGGEPAAKDNAAFVKAGLDDVVTAKLAKVLRIKEDLIEDERIAKDAKKREQDERASTSDKKRGHPSDREWSAEALEQLSAAVDRYPAGTATRWKVVADFVCDRMKPDTFTQVRTLSNLLPVKIDPSTSSHEHHNSLTPLHPPPPHRTSA